MTTTSPEESGWAPRRSSSRQSSRLNRHHNMRTGVTITTCFLLGAAVCALGYQRGVNSDRQLIWEPGTVVTSGTQVQPAFNNAALVSRGPNGTVHAVTGTGFAPLYAWRPAGGEWSTTSITAGTGAARRPCLSWAGDQLYVAWTAGGEVVLTHSAGGYASWATPERIAGGDPDGVSLHAVGGAVVLAWTDRSSGRVMYSHWDGSLTPPQPLDDAGGFSEDVALFGDGDDVWAAWDNRPTMIGARTIYFAHSGDGGISFDGAQPIPVTQKGHLPASGNDVSGCATGADIWLGYQDPDGMGGFSILLAHSDDGGASFDAFGTLGPGLFAHVACEGLGAVAVAWEYFHGADSKNNAVKTVGLAVTLDAGAHFDGPHAMPGSADANGRAFPAIGLRGDTMDLMFVDTISSSWVHAPAQLQPVPTSAPPSATPSQRASAPTPTPTPCDGDCNPDGQVTVDEILTMVNIALGDTDVSVCPAGDSNKDRQITVDEILTAVYKAINGCTG